jgi:hypothetical protein
VRRGWTIAALAALALLAPTGPAAETGAQTGGLTSFEVHDVYLDVGSDALSAYEVEILLGPVQAGEAGARLVGLEGNVELPFQDPPHFDPRALRGQRVVIAAFSTAPAAELPTGRVRVATLHIEVEGPAPELEVRVRAVGDGAGKRIQANAWTTRGS